MLAERELIALPAHALLIVEERLREQQREGVRIPEGMAWTNWPRGFWRQP
jgi:hypothetical protein